MTLIGKLAAGALALALTTGAAVAADWPSGPIRLVIPAKPGGGTDVMGRVFAEYLQRETGASVAVVNQPAGGGTVGYEMVRTARPDGQTLLFMHTSLLIHSHTGRYPHGLDDFTPIAYAQIYPSQVYAVAADAPWDTLADFLDDARNNPGQKTIGVSLGGTTHFIAGMMEQAADVELKMVEASSEVDKVAAIQGGHIDIGNLGAESGKQFEDAGKMKVLALIDPKPNPDFADYSTAIEQGVEMSWETPLLLFGPAGMDPEVVARINEATRNMGSDPAVQDSLEKMSSGYVYHSVEETQKLMAEEDARIANLAISLGIASTQ